MEDAVIVVSGLPRSGTSMMMQMLDAGGLPVLTDNLRRPDEDNPRGYYEFEAVKGTRDDPSWLRDAGGKAVKMVYRLLYDLPDDRTYRVIFMTRDLVEVIKSQEVMLDRSGKSGGSLDDRQLRDVYRRQLAEAKAWLDAQANFHVKYVDYADVVDDSSRVATEVNDFLSFNLDTRAMAGVPDAALYRIRT